MLVLSRQREQSIICTTPSGERIEVTVMDIRGDKVRLGFTADRSIEIDRSEIRAAKDARREGVAT